MNTEAASTETYPKGQPKAFYMLFSVEMWERFGYYAMRALLVLYMSNVFLFSDDKAFATFAAFSSLLYVTPVFGGWVGDRLIGYRRALMFGAVLLAAGYFILMIHAPLTFYLGLALVVVGNGFFKPSPASLLGKVYGRKDPRIQSGYTLFYMSINIGSFIGIALSGFIAHHFGWSLAFGLSGLGLFFSLCIFIAGLRLIKDAGSRVGLQPLSLKMIPIILIGTAVLVVAVWYLLQYTFVATWVLYGTCIAVGLYLVSLVFKLHGQERNRFIVSLVLIFVAIAFFALYFQAPTSVNLFTERNVQRHVFGFFIPTSTYQCLNPFFVVTLAPVLAGLYKLFALQKINVSIPMKFAVGTALMGLGFLVLEWCAATASAQGLVSSWWLVLSYFLQSVAELLVSALGVAMMAKLVPHRYLGLMMGAWYLASAVAAMLGGTLAKWASVSATQVKSPLVSLHIYAHTFDLYGWGAIIISAVVFCLVPLLQRMMK